MARGFVGFLILVVLAFVFLPGLLSGAAGPLGLGILVALALLFVPSFRRFAIGAVVLAVLAAFAYSAVVRQYEAAKQGATAAVFGAPASATTAIHDALFVPGLYTTGDSVFGSWLDWVQHGYREFEGTPFVLGSGDRCCADPNDIQQGALGDCFILASLGALATVSPSTIIGAIHDNGDKTYGVTLHVADRAGHLAPVVITVDDRFPGFRWPYSMTQPNPLFAQVGEPGGSPRELWVMLIESAFAQAEQDGYQQLNQGGRGFDTLQAMTGRTSIVVHPHDVTRDNLGATLASLERSGYAMTAGTVDVNQIIETGPNPLLVDTGQNDARLVSTHEYFVRHYDPVAEKVTLGNPHTRGSTVVLTLDEFKFAIDSVFFNRPAASSTGGACHCP